MSNFTDFATSSEAGWLLFGLSAFVVAKLLLTFVEHHNRAREGYAKAKEAEEQARQYYQELEREYAARLVAAVRGKQSGR